ncbi:hypothetical protein Lal_00017089 [Lupinus albus]|nr:hypothetical protein Lal_00017089 [Lupinus albus]
MLGSNCKVSDFSPTLELWDSSVGIYGLGLSNLDESTRNLEQLPKPASFVVQKQSFLLCSMIISRFAQDNNVYIEFHPSYCSVKSQVDDKFLLEGTLGPDGL